MRWSAHRSWRGLSGALAAALLLGGCGSDDSELGDLAQQSGGDPGEFQGGQTGSLVPRCGLATRTAIAQGAEATIVLRTDGCEGSVRPEDLSLVDAAGNALDYEVDSSPDGALVLRLPAEESVTVTISDGAGLLEPETVAVVRGEDATTREAVIPEGEIASFDVGDDRVLRVDLALFPPDSPLSEYVAVDIRIDHFDATTIVPFGELDSVDGSPIRVELPLCDPGCLGPGVHTFSVVGRLAGTERTIDFGRDAFWMPSPEATSSPPGDDTERCSTTATAGRGAPKGYPFGLAGLALAALLRRRRR